MAKRKPKVAAKREEPNYPGMIHSFYNILTFLNFDRS